MCISLLKCVLHLVLRGGNGLIYPDDNGLLDEDDEDEEDDARNAVFKDQIYLLQLPLA